MTCNQGHKQISYGEGSCPLCQSLRYNREIKHSFENAQWDLLVNEVEMLFDFGIGEDKLFKRRGQA